MAGCAIVAQPALVRLAFPMAVDAAALGVAKRDIRFVASGTSDSLVAAVQREISEAMVEQRGIELDHIRVSTFVFGVAVLAQARACGEFESVKASAGCHVVRDRFVTIQAEGVLRAAFERGVAFAALTFPLSVSFDDGAGHHQVFQGST